MPELIVAVLLVIIFLMVRSKFRRPAIFDRIQGFFERKRTTQLLIVNQYREEFELEPLSAEPSLHKLAKANSIFMAENGKCTSDEEAVRVEKIQKLAGTRYVGKNCFFYASRDYNKRMDGRLVQGWLRSPKNRANILSRRYKRIGIGIVSRGGNVYVTQVFSA